MWIYEKNEYMFGVEYRARVMRPQTKYPYKLNVLKTTEQSIYTQCVWVRTRYFFCFYFISLSSPSKIQPRIYVDIKQFFW